MVTWDADANNDLLVGRGDGKVQIFLNTGTNDLPVFDGGSFLQVGPAGSKVDIDVGSRATATSVDWNNDEKKDLVVGALDGKIHIFLNEGSDTSPDFLAKILAQADAGDLIVPSVRSSPAVVDLDGDGKKDLLTGNTNGQLVFYSNVATDAAPAFSTYSLVESSSVPIDLPGTPRSRPFVCDWTRDGALDVLIGAADGRVRLYEGITLPTDLDGDGDLDLDDYAIFHDALGGPDVPVIDACTSGDLDGDGDTDLVDFGHFQIAFAG
ncbi:MAG: VCBS repeat-containing protein [bacterium]|nr:VCBS repeat-containing protein [bacterium]